MIKINQDYITDFFKQAMLAFINGSSRTYRLKLVTIDKETKLVGATYLCRGIDLVEIMGNAEMSEYIRVSAGMSEQEIVYRMSGYCTKEILESFTFYPPNLVTIEEKKAIIVAVEKAFTSIQSSFSNKSYEEVLA